MKNYTVFFSIICLICIAVVLVTGIFRSTGKSAASDADSEVISESVGTDEGHPSSEDGIVAVSDGYADVLDAATDAEAVSEGSSPSARYDFVSWIEWDVPKHTHDDIRRLLSYEDTGWRRAYAEVLLEYESSEGFDPQSSRWDLYDLDKSCVPELVYMPYTSGGGPRNYIVYIYTDGTAEMMMDVFSDGIAYCPEDSLICWERLMQGEYYNVVLRLENDDIAERHAFYTNDGAVDEDAAVYTIDDEKVTKDEFDGRLRSPESKEEEANWDYIGAHFAVGEYDDIFFMGVYPNVVDE